MIVVCFCVSAIVPSVKNACFFFPVFWAFWGGFFLFICVSKVWVFLCFLFLVFFLVLVLFLFVCFVLWLDVVVSVSVFLCFFFFVFFV